MSQIETKPEDLLRRRSEEWETPRPEEQAAPEEEQQPFSFEEPPPPKPDLAQARLFATEPRPAGFGEVLVTDVWARPEPKQAKEGEEPPDRQKAWEARQELRELGLLREKPMVSYDARFETYWKQVVEAEREAAAAIIDPYTRMAGEFADVDLGSLAEHRAVAGEYGRGADALLALGRAYWAIGRHKGARSALEAAARAERQHPEVWYNLGVVRLLGRANKAAREALIEAVDQAPGDFRPELALAVASYHLRDYAAAEEQFKRLAGSEGLRATARSMLACSLRMQGRWDEARVELGFLREAHPGDWGAMSQQCLDCVERGEQKLFGALRARRRSGQMWRSLAAVAAGGIWLAYGFAEKLFQREAQWAVIPLFVLGLLLARSLRRISGRELPGEFGNAEQGLICWQSTAWMRPRHSEF
ncbi:MAG: tetratricopeptide repeat protein [Armatimonadota bacterium]